MASSSKNAVKTLDDHDYESNETTESSDQVLSTSSSTSANVKHETVEQSYRHQASNSHDSPNNPSPHRKLKRIFLASPLQSNLLAQADSTSYKPRHQILFARPYDEFSVGDIPSTTFPKTDNSSFSTTTKTA